jgi:hypothetical protein
VCKKYNKKATVFYAKRNPENYTYPQKLAIGLGLNIIWVNMGMLTVTKKRARDYVSEDVENRVELPMGLEHDTVFGSIIKVARELELERPPSEIWCVGSSGTLNRGLQLAFPDIQVHCVQIGHAMNERELGRATKYISPYKFDKEVKGSDKPPFPSIPTYDAKAWSFIKQYAKKDALFWNVA